MRLVIIGFSTRAIAESAWKSAYDFISLDYFGDRDQKEQVENLSLLRDFNLGFSARALVKACSQLDFEAVVYASTLENHPSLVERLIKGHTLLGNPPQTLREVRDIKILRSFFQNEEMMWPKTILAEETMPISRGKWLRKNIKSGGGHGIAFWKGKSLAKGQYLQEYIEGIPCSAAFVADGRDCVLLGITEQLIGIEELGAEGFAWCGNIIPLSLPPKDIDLVISVVKNTASRLTQRFGLRGVNGFDFLLAKSKVDFTPYMIEVNPRYTASMELLERAFELNIFDLHVQSFNRELPSFSLLERLAEIRFWGKGIVYARRNLLMPDTADWKSKGRRDIPFPGERILKKRPICTVFAQGESRAECWHRLLVEADYVRHEIGETL